MPIFSTLGPAASNHVFVLRRYLDAHGLPDAEIRLFEDFHAGADALQAGNADYMLQCAAHPEVPAITGAFRQTVMVVDAFVSPSQPMALVRMRAPQRFDRESVAIREAPPACERVGVQPATERYVDLGAWRTVVHEPTVAHVQEGLLEGRYDAGIVFTGWAQEMEERVEVLSAIGTVCDAWILFGRERVDGGRPVVWTSSPVSRRFRVQD